MRAARLVPGGSARTGRSPSEDVQGLSSWGPCRHVLFVTVGVLDEANPHTLLWSVG